MNTQETTPHSEGERPPRSFSDFEFMLMEEVFKKLLTPAGKIPGYGGGDRVLAILEPGEFIVRKEAVAQYGIDYLHALNSMRLNIDPSLTEGEQTVDVCDNLEQIQDNSQAIGSITKVLNFISLMKMKPRCETCGEWHDHLINGGTSANLTTALRSLSQYTDLLAYETKKNLTVRNETKTGVENQQSPA